MSIRHLRRFGAIAGEGAPLELSKALKARYVQPGEILLRNGDVPRQVCFIASGAVEVETEALRVWLDSLEQGLDEAGW